MARKIARRDLDMRRGEYTGGWQLTVGCWPQRLLGQRSTANGERHLIVTPSGYDRKRPLPYTMSQSKLVIAPSRLSVSILPSWPPEMITYFCEIGRAHV